MRVVPTLVHGMLDYATAILLLVLAAVFAVSQGVAVIMGAAAAVIIAYSLVTCYEAGAWKLLPMSMHLVLDAILGVLLILAALILTEAAAPRITLGLIGLFSVVMSFITRQVPFVFGDVIAASGPPIRGRGLK